MLDEDDLAGARPSFGTFQGALLSDWYYIDMIMLQ